MAMMEKAPRLHFNNKQPFTDLGEGLFVFFTPRVARLEEMKPRNSTDFEDLRRRIRNVFVWSTLLSSMVLLPSS
jgi:hypothetical protein